MSESVESLRPLDVTPVAKALEALERSVRAGSRARAREAAALLLSKSIAPADSHGGKNAWADAFAPLRDEAPIAWNALERAARSIVRIDGPDAIDRGHEALLRSLSPESRTRRGAFFTPLPLVRFVVEAAAQIKSEQRWDGPSILIDPAAGAGIFVETARARFTDRTRFVAHEIDPLTAAVLRTRFDDDARVTVREIDTLRDTRRWSTDDETLIVIGNPPFSGHSASSGDLATQLLRGEDPVTNAICESYAHIDGVAMDERNPKWLQDDCVKFIRFAQWQLSRARRGVVALVCTHGFAHHATFRAMRHSLWRAHDRMLVLDLHGNVKKLERATDGTRDQNVFDVQQGIAVLLFWRGEGRARPQPVRVADVWGTRAHKLETLARATLDSLPWNDVIPAAPSFVFAPQDLALRAEYEQGIAIDAWFRAISPCVVTGRDGLLVAMTREELLARLDAMRDASIDDETFRTRYLREGDSIDVAAARRATRAHPDPGSAIGPILYRPFDVRWLLALDPWIERPRRTVMDPLRRANGSVLALLARRQSPPSRQAPFVFVTNLPAADGVIRSDNHGSESILPLATISRDGTIESALEPEVSARFGEILGVVPSDAELFAYVYAMLHAPSYRMRYADFLRRSFPRIPLPPSRKRFDALVRFGQRLIELHTGSSLATGISHVDSPVLVERIRHEDGAVFLGAIAAFRPVSERAWNFAVGGHYPLRKWLEDRRGMVIGNDRIEEYARMVTAIEETVVTMGKIETVSAEDASV